MLLFQEMLTALLRFERVHVRFLLFATLGLYFEGQTTREQMTFEQYEHYAEMTAVVWQNRVARVAC